MGKVGAPRLPSTILPLAMPDKCSPVLLSPTLLLPSATCLPKAGPVLGTQKMRLLEGVPPVRLLVHWTALVLSGFSPPTTKPAAPLKPSMSCPTPTPHLFLEQVWERREVIQAPKGVTFRCQEKGGSMKLFLTKRMGHNSTQQPHQDRCLGRRSRFGRRDL